MSPLTWCGLATAAAITAAAIGHYNRADLRAARRLRREKAAATRQRRHEVDAALYWVAGRFAVHDGEALFYRFLAAHRELYADQPATSTPASTRLMEA